MFIDSIEFVRKTSGRFTGAEEQVTVFGEREMKQPEHGFLCLWLEIDQQVPARNQMHLRERRILRDIVRREHNQLPKVLRDVITGRFLAKESFAAAVADVF